MSLPRRRLVRPAPPSANGEVQRKIHDLRSRLEAEQLTLHRWMAKLKRAFHVVEKQEKTVSRLQRQLRQLEELDASHHRSDRVARG
jgi:hypothetical protein